MSPEALSNEPGRMARERKSAVSMEEQGACSFQVADDQARTQTGRVQVPLVREEENQEGLGGGGDERYQKRECEDRPSFSWIRTHDACRVRSKTEIQNGIGEGPSGESDTVNAKVSRPEVSHQKQAGEDGPDFQGALVDPKPERIPTEASEGAMRALLKVNGLRHLVGAHLLERRPGVGPLRSTPLPRVF